MSKNISKINTILFVVVLILSVVIDIYNDTNISTCVLLIECLITSIYTIIKMKKARANYVVRIVFTFSAILVVLSFLIDLIFPSFLSKYTTVSFSFRTGMSVFLLISIIITSHYKKLEKE